MLESAMVRAISGHSAPKSGMATAIAAIPVAYRCLSVANFRRKECEIR